MTTRLVYAPKAYVFTKSQDGTLYNLSPYVTGGEVQLNIGQCSTAAVTLRNPYRIFTTPAAGAAFHPQDPITIYLERLAGFPVRVFTGYLDKTPYYQLQPGVIQLQASCVLKRLLYTFFDPSLPYVTAFFEKYGWFNTGTGSVISSAAFGPQGANQKQATTNPPTLLDGSLSKILWAVLYDIGGWHDSNIWIEPLPSGANGIVARMEALMKSMQTTQTEAADYFSQFLTAVVGTGGQGSGGGTAGGATGVFTGGPLSSPSGLTIKGSPMNATQLHFANMILATGQQLGGSPLACSVVMLQAICESGMGIDMTWNPTYGGLLAGNVNTFGSLGADTSDAVAQAEINSAFKGGNGYNYPGGALAATGSDIMSIAEQNAGCGNQYTQEAGYNSGWIQEAQNIVAAGQNNKGTSGNSKGGVSTIFNSISSTLASNTAATATPGIAGTKTQSGKTSASAAAAGSTTRYQVIIQAANTINDKHFPYIWGGGHGSAGVPTGGGFDCSGAVSAVMFAAGLTTSSFDTFDEVSALGSNIVPGLDTGPNAVNIFVNTTTHTYMQIGGKFWGTWAGGSSAPGGGGWCSDGSTSLAGYNPYHVPQAILAQPTQNALPAAAGGPGGTATLPGGGSASGTGTATGGTTNQASAEAFVGQLDFPSIEDQVTAILLGSEGKGLMHDQNLMPFVQQIAQASMRSFMSLPNGDFYAFYPDYFGEMGQHDPYWMIDDIEITSGTISLSDDGLATHVFAVGDNSWPVNEELLNELFSAGTISVFNAFVSDGIIQTGTGKLNPKDKKAQVNSPGAGPTHGLADVMNAKEAVDFVKRYGARPLVQNYPQVRSPIFEMLMAYQLFMQAWANQFLTPFEFTFMPELFPGGKIGFPNHGLMMYVNQVTHSWDYTEGFTTTAELSSPSLLNGKQTNPDLPPNMVAALVEPIRNKPISNASALEGGVVAAIGSSISAVEQTVNDAFGGLGGLLNPPKPSSTDPIGTTLSPTQTAQTILGG